MQLVYCTNLSGINISFWNDNQTCTHQSLFVQTRPTILCTRGVKLPIPEYRLYIYIMIQHLCDLVSPTTSLVFPENLGTAPELGDSVKGLSCTGMSFVTSGIEFMLWLFVEFKLFSTGLPFVLIWARCFFKSARVPEIFERYGQWCVTIMDVYKKV